MTWVRIPVRAFIKMIKKNTKIVFEGNSGEMRELKGGVPLSKREMITLNKTEKFEVVDKIVEIEDKGEDQIVDITYKLKKIK